MAGYNGYGTVGSAPAPGYMHMWDVYDADGLTAAALEWAYDLILSYTNQVVNMSYGVPGPSEEWEEDAIADLWDDGALLIAAVGSSAQQQVVYPAGFPNVIGVAGSDESDGKGSPSGCGNSTNWGSDVDLVAPYKVYTTDVNGGYRNACGTSFAAPRVAGVAASVWSIHYTESRAQVLARLTSTAHALSWSGSGYGLVDHWAAAFDY